MASIRFKQVRVEIQRGKDVLSVHVPEHEVRVLKAVHRPEHVRAVEDSPYRCELPDNADGEYARLSRKYFRPNAPDAVGIAYPLGGSMLESFGFTLQRADDEPAPQSEFIDHELIAQREADAAEALAATEGKTRK